MKDGVIVPNFDHSEVIEAVFRRTRVPVGVMTAAKLLSAVEPVIRYQRGRFRGAEQAVPGSVRYSSASSSARTRAAPARRSVGDGRAGASLGFATARLFDQLDPLEKRKDAALAAAEVSGMKATMRWLKALELERARAARAGGAPARRAGERASPSCVRTSS